MAFDDLTPNQIQPLIQIIEALNAGSYNDEFIMRRHAGQQLFTIALYEKGKTSSSNRKIEGFTDTDIQALKEEGYITTSGGRASLKAKAFKQYTLYRNQMQAPNVMNHATYLRMLVKVYNAIGDNPLK
ncbi:MAG TPA: hypothetical protein VF553_02600 [Pyrinomonadaceae bacterium]|jgi:hypothetical protein